MADTKRDIQQRVKVNGEDVATKAAHLMNCPVGSQDATDTIANINANVAAITASMAAYAAAAP
jgi:hypothetical protein